MNHILLAATTLAVLPSAVSPSFAQPPPPRVDILAGGITGCGGGCGGMAAVGGATRWLTDNVGLSARLNTTDNFLWTDFFVRARGFVGDKKDKEIDFAFGRGHFFDYYHHSWNVELLVGFRLYDKVGFKVGPSIVYYYKDSRRPDGTRNLDGALIINFLMVIRQ